MNLKGTKPGANSMDDSNPLDRSTRVEAVDELLSEFFIVEDIFSKASD